MPYEKIVSLCTGTCCVPAGDVVRSLIGVLEKPRNYAWKLDINKETGAAKLLCLDAKNKKIIEAVQAQLSEPIKDSRSFSRLIVNLTIEGVITRVLSANKCYDDLLFIAQDFKKSFSGYQHPSAFSRQAQGA